MTRNGLLLRDYLPYKIGIVRGHISKVFEDKCLSDTSVSISGWRVLALVAVEKDMSGSDVVERSGMRKMAVSRAVSKLVDSGLLRTTPSKTDGRRLCLNVTRKGRRIYESIIPAAKKFESKIVENLDSNDQQALSELLSRVLSSVDNLAESGESLYENRESAG